MIDLKVSFSEINVISCKTAAQHSVHPTGGSLRVFKQFFWLEAASGKMALSRPAHTQVTPAVGLKRLKRSVSN